MSTPIVIDCDPGHDDMMAIMLAMAHPAVELLGVSTVAGNQTGAKTHLNARRILTLIGARGVPVARGADAPLCRPLITAHDIHGTSGLDGAELPEPRVATDPDAAPAFLARTIADSPRKVTLVPTGPLTNVALTLRAYPAIADKIDRIVLMGGAMHDSNVSPVAEFNIFVDPEAAAAVFRCGLPITMIGLDATNKAIIDAAQIAELEAMGGPISGIVAPLMRFFLNANRRAFAFGGAPIHDALAVAAVIAPDIVSTNDYYVDVETQGELTRGQTVVDRFGVTKKPANARVAVGVDRNRFMKMMFEAIVTLDRQARAS